MMKRILNDINYLITSAHVLSEGKDTSITKDLLKYGCNQLFFGKPIDFTQTLDLCAALLLLNDDGKRVSLTKLGQKFAKLNKKRRYEIDDSQINLLQLVIHRTPLAKDVVGGKGEDSSRNVNLLVELGLAKKVNNRTKLKTDFIDETNSRIGGGISEKELEMQLAEKRTYGARAEEFVVVYEKKRLQSIGMARQSKNVRRVGNIDVSLGYDVESFTTAAKKPDRFIEVKCTKNPFMRFYWSSKEVDVAKRLGERYFIYFVWIDTNGLPTEVEIIQNPAKNILENKTRFLISMGTIVVREL